MSSVCTSSNIDIPAYLHKGIYIMLLMLFYPCTSPGESELMPMTSLGSGSGSGITIAPPTCNTTTLRLDVSLFDTIIDKLLQLKCSVAEGSYEILFKSAEIGLDLTEFDNTAIFGDYFSYSDNLQMFSLEVCSFDILMGDVCSDELITVSAEISRHTDRLLPFGASFSENIIANADDLSMGVFLSKPILFWGRYYNSIYVSQFHILRI